MGEGVEPLDRLLRHDHAGVPGAPLGVSKTFARAPSGDPRLPLAEVFRLPRSPRIDHLRQHRSAIAEDAEIGFNKETKDKSTFVADISKDHEYFEDISLENSIVTTMRYNNGMVFTNLWTRWTGKLRQTGEEIEVPGVVKHGYRHGEDVHLGIEFDLSVESGMTARRTEFLRYIDARRKAGGEISRQALRRA